MKDVPGYEGLYAVTSCGRVWSHKRKKFMVPCKGTAGYLRIGLRNFKSLHVRQFKMFGVARLVVMTYIPNPLNLPEVNHKDENKENNCVNNLEWCDRKYNINYGSRTEKAKKSMARYWNRE